MLFSLIKVAKRFRQATSLLQQSEPVQNVCFLNACQHCLHSWLGASRFLVWTLNLRQQPRFVNQNTNLSAPVRVPKDISQQLKFQTTAVLAAEHIASLSFARHFLSGKRAPFRSAPLRASLSANLPTTIPLISSTYPPANAPPSQPASTPPLPSKSANQSIKIVRQRAAAVRGVVINPIWFSFRCRIRARFLHCLLISSA